MNSVLPLLFVVLSVSELAGAKSLQECMNCFVTELPSAIGCDLESSTCNLLECGWGSEVVDFEACGCQDCVDPVLTCLNDCTPPCLDTVLDPFVDCMVTPECYTECSNVYDFSDVNSIVNSDAYNSITLPDFAPPSQTCNTLTEFATDPVDCLYPTFPTCDVIQQDVVGGACDLIDCCPECHAEMATVLDCFYNWASGYECGFQCDAPAVDTADTTTAISKTAAAAAAASKNGGVRKLVQAAIKKSSAGKRKMSELTPEQTNEAADFEAECREHIALDILERPAAVVNNYMSCILSNTMKMVTDETNQPEEEEEDEIEAPENGNDEEDDEEDGASGGLMLNGTLLSLYTALVLLCWF